MSAIKFLRTLLDRGIELEQALLAAELYEANPPKSPAAVRQQRYDDEQPIVRSGRWNEGEWQRRRRIVFERDGYVCVYCGADVRSNPQCDHVVPLMHGGGHELSNLATACKRCNSGKSGKLLQDWEGPKWGSFQRQ